MIGKTNGNAGIKVSSGETAITSVVEINNQSTGSGWRTFNVSLTGLRVGYLHTIYVNCMDGSQSFNPVQSSFSISAPDCEGTSVFIPINRKAGATGDNTPLFGKINIFAVHFIPQKSDVTVGVSWLRTGGTDNRIRYEVTRFD